MAVGDNKKSSEVHLTFRDEEQMHTVAQSSAELNEDVQLRRRAVSLAKRRQT